MLKKRILPCFDIKDGRIVKGVNFVNLIDMGDPVTQARAYVDQGADELVFLDISATVEGRATTRELVAKMAREINIPFTVGGGIKSVADVAALLEAGADKITVNSAAVARPELIAELAREFGSQCVVLSIDANWVAEGEKAASHERTAHEETIPSTTQSILITGNEIHKEPGTSSATKLPSPGAWRVVIHGGRTPTDLDPVAWARRAEALGAGEVLLTSMRKDGTRSGFDLDLTRKVAAAVNIPVIASGGAGTPAHFREVFDHTEVAAALAAGIFHEGLVPIPQLKTELARTGIPVRLT